MLSHTVKFIHSEALNVSESRLSPCRCKIVYKKKQKRKNKELRKYRQFFFVLVCEEILFQEPV